MMVAQLNFIFRATAEIDILPMKNTENAERPMSVMLYSLSRRGLLRRSGRPAQTFFSSAICDSRTLTAPANRRSRRAARQNHQIRQAKAMKSATSCIFDSPGNFNVRPRVSLW
jgi:hypothetical protein